MTILTDDFAFIHVPKTGGTYIITVFLNPGHGSKESRQKRAASPLPDLPSRWHPSFLGAHKTIHQLFDRTADNYAHSRHQLDGGLPLLANKRNPWAWYASWYEFSKGHLTHTPESRQLVEGQEWGYFSEAGKHSLSQTIKHMYDQNYRGDWGGEGHPSSRAIRRWRGHGDGIYTDRYRIYLQLNTDLEPTREDGSSWPVTYLRCEALKEELYAYLEKFGPVPAAMKSRVDSLPKANVSVRADYRTYYDDESAELVLQENKGLIGKFGYTFDE